MKDNLMSNSTPNQLEVKEVFCMICEEIEVEKQDDICQQCYENECKSRGWTP